MIQKILVSKEGKKFYVKDISQDFHCQYGMVKKADLKKSKAKTNKGKELSVINANFLDNYEKIKRAPQIIPLKDIGAILTKTGIGKNSKVLDAGTGSGALALMLGNFVKEVITYEIREDFFKIAKKNFENFPNIKIKNKDLKDVKEKNFDLITLDLPSPWENIDKIAKSLKKGGYIVSYSPTIPQVMDFVEEIKKNSDLLYIETIEILERQWEIQERKVRPRSQQIGHSGFLTFVRKI